MAHDDATPERENDDAQADDYSGTTTVVLNGYRTAVAGVHVDEDRSRSWTRDGYEETTRTRVVLVGVEADKQTRDHYLDAAGSSGHTVMVAPGTGDPFAAHGLEVTTHYSDGSRLVLEQRDEDSEIPFPTQDLDLERFAEGDHVRLSFLDKNNEESEVVGTVERSDSLGASDYSLEVREDDERDAVFTLEHYEGRRSMVRGYGPVLSVEEVEA